MIKTKIGVLGAVSFLVILMFTYYAGAQSKPAPELLAWCFNMTASPEDEDLILVVRTNAFGEEVPMKAFRVGERWFLSTPDRWVNPAPPIREQFVAWQRVPGKDK